MISRIEGVFIMKHRAFVQVKKVLVDAGCNCCGFSTRKKTLLLSIFKQE